MARNGEVTAVLISHGADIHAVDEVRMEFVYICLCSTSSAVSEQ